MSKEYDDRLAKIVDEFYKIDEVRVAAGHNKMWSVELLYKQFGHVILNRRLLTPVAKALVLPRHVVFDYVKYKIMHLPHGKNKRKSVK